MDKYLYTSIKKLFDTMANVGYIASRDKNALFVAVSLYSIYNTFIKIVTAEDTFKLNEYLHCLASSHPCLFAKFMPELSHSVETHSLITILENDVIATQNGAIQVSMSGRTQEFPDFETRTNIQMDNYVVGYDESDQKEVKYNVTDLGLFWEVDI